MVAIEVQSWDGRGCSGSSRGDSRGSGCGHGGGVQGRRSRRVIAIRWS